MVPVDHLQRRAAGTEGLVVPERGALDPSFGIATAPQQVDYADVQRVWLEADEVPEIDHAWLFDHLLPIGGDPLGPIFEGWTLLSALAAQTTRLRLGLLVTSNRFRPPALLAKMAATVDVVSGGRLEFGIGAGSNATVPSAGREYAAYGMPYSDAADAVAALAEALTIIRRLWTETESFNFAGVHHQLTGAFGEPKPTQKPVPPILVGGRSTATLQVAAEHADVWSFPGSDVPTAAARSRRLDQLCSAIGRDPAAIVRSLIIPISYDAPAASRSHIDQALEAGFRHLVLSLPAPYPTRVAHWIAEAIIAPYAAS